MRKKVVKMLKKEVTEGHPYEQLKKEYKEMKRKTGEPKPKEKRKSGQDLVMVKMLLGKGKHKVSIVDKGKFIKRIERSKITPLPK